MVNIDKLMEIDFGITKLMPIINGGSHKVTNLDTTTRLPKSMILEELRVNEKFLNKYQSVIEDNLSKKQLDNFVAYQNWNFKHGRGETKRNQKQYSDANELTKENLFSNVNVKTEKELEKTGI